MSSNKLVLMLVYLMRVVSEDPHIFIIVFIMVLMQT